METNNFFEAFNESSRLEEAGVVGTMAKNAVNKVGNKIANSKLVQKVKNSKPAQAVSNAVANAKDQVNQQKTNDANNFAETYKALKGEDGKSGILGELQAIANESANFEDIDGLMKRINAIQSLDNGVKKQINQMLNQQKAALQQKEQPADNQQNNAEKPAENGDNAANEEATPATNTEGQPENAGNTSAGDANNIANNTKAKPTVDAINRGLSSGLSVDDLIAYLQTLKK